VPTISDLKDQARAFEQQGDVERALTIYQHILKHLEGTPAISKVLPLYVKAGDLLAKLDRAEEAVVSYQAAAEQYAASGAAPRVTSLCAKILRLAPERTDVYTSFTRLLIDHNHVGSARDVLAEYAKLANMDRAMETLDDLAGRPNSEVQPMLERLLESFELEDGAESAAERVSSHLQQVTDDLAGELTTVPDSQQEEDTTAAVTEEAEPEAAEEEGDEPESAVEDQQPESEIEEEDAETKEAPSGAEPMTPPMFDLDHMPRQSMLQQSEIREDDEEEVEEEDEDTVGDETSGLAVTRDVSPTMEGPAAVVDEVEEEEVIEEEEDTEEQPEEDQEDKLDLLTADALSSETGEQEEEGATPPTDIKVETSEWTPEFLEPSAEDAVASDWSPEEELEPAARYPSDEYDTPEEVEEKAEGEVESDEEEVTAEAEEPAIDDEFAAGTEEPAIGEDAFDVGEEGIAAGEDEPVGLIEDEPSEQMEEKQEAPQPPAIEEVETAPPPEPEIAVEPVRRPTRPPRMSLPTEPESSSKSPILFGIGGLIIGALAGAAAMYFYLGGGASPAVSETADPVPAAVTDSAPVAELPEVTTPDEGETTLPADEAVDAEQEETPPAEVVEDEPADSVSAPAEIEAPPPLEMNTTPDPIAAEAEQEAPAEGAALDVSPIIVEGMEIDEISEVESDGRPGFRVVHLLDWADPLIIEAYRDTSVSMSTFIQVTVTPPDTVVGVRRIDGYLVVASGQMPEDSLRSLMTRLTEGERPDR